MADIEFTDEDVASLGRKLSGLDLEGTEKALMHALLGLAGNAFRTVKVESLGPPTAPSTLHADVEPEDLPNPGDAVTKVLPPDAPPTSPVVFNSVRGEPFFLPVPQV